ncbi:MAG: hypothetical protein ACM3XR_08105 [Bacillota bacterium]
MNMNIMTDACSACFKRQENEIINIGKTLLDEGTVDAVLAYADSEAGIGAVPRFFRKAEDLASMRWNEACTPNLAKYLPGAKGKIAVAAKPCDARAIVMYMVEKQVDRNNIYIIGIECAGLKGKDGMPAAGCSECTVRTPPVYDVLVKNPDVSGNPEQNNGQIPREKSVQYEEQSIEQKFERFRNELQKCIMCYTCRQACYGCYCKVCFAERDLPGWMPADMDMGMKMEFHLGRAMHLAGRCVECGACERVCPSGVRIRYLIKEITALCRELYGYSAGMDPDETPALANFSEKDREVGFLGGECDGTC